MHYAKVAPGAVAALRGLEDYVEGRRLERPLLELVRTRASQLNGCAYCVDMHTRDARAEGETEQRLHVVAVWRETPFFSNRERAALAWTEAVTLVSDRTISDADYAAVREQFDERELVDLTVAIVAINGWNRMAVAFRPVPGSYQRREPDTSGAGEDGRP
ncbi:MAG: carboxymuconolactone decarboxylase family protein [Gemmatimonadales bacterium]